MTITTQEKSEKMADKILDKCYPLLHSYYRTSMTRDYPEVIKENLHLDFTIFIVRNKKGDLKFSSSPEYGTVLISDKEIKDFMKKEISIERPSLVMIKEKLAKLISKL